MSQHPRKKDSPDQKEKTFLVKTIKNFPDEKVPYLKKNLIYLDELVLNKIDLDKIDPKIINHEKIDLDKIDPEKHGLNKEDMNKLDLDKLDLKRVITVIYRLFYEIGSPIRTAEVTYKLGYKNAGKFIERFVKVHLSSESSKKSYSPKLISSSKINGNYLLHPFALILKTEDKKIYDFTSTSNQFYEEFYKDPTPYASELSTTFYANFDKISENITVNLCEQEVSLKDFLKWFEKEDPRVILEILINIAKDEFLPYTLDNLKEKVFSELKEYKEKYYVNPLVLPHHSKELKQLVTENRAEDLKNALICLEENRILFLSGIGGVGKSVLARALIDCRPVNVPEPFWLNFNHNQDIKLGDILEKLAFYLNDLESIAAFKAEKREPVAKDVDKLIYKLRRKSEVWLVFDNLETVLEDRHFVDERIELLFLYLRDNTHNAKIIITSQVIPEIKNTEESLLDIVKEGKKLILNGLKTNFAIDYLVKSGLDGVERKKLEEVVTSVDGHPLVLKLLLDPIKAYGATYILEDPSIYNEKIEQFVKRLVEKQATNEKELLERISVYREPVSIKGLKQMLKENIPINVVKQLIDKSLIETENVTKLEKNYCLHSLVQKFSYENLKNKKEAHMLAYDYYSSIPLPENPRTKEDLQPSIEAYFHACEAEKYDLAAQMILLRSKLHISLDNWGDYTTLEEMYRRLLPKEQFKDKALLNNKKMESLVFGKLGYTRLQLGNPTDALNYYKHALKITRENGEKNEEIDFLINMGTSYRYQGELEEEIGCYKQALKIARDTKNSYEETYILAKLGYKFYYWGDIQKEIERYESAIKKAEESGNEERRGELLALLGTVYSNQGKHKEAIEYCEKAVEIAKKLNIRRLQEDCLGYLGFAYRCSGNRENLDKALEHYNNALEIAKKINDRIGEGRRCGSIGIVYSIQNKTEKAIKQYEIALEIAEETEDKGGKGKWLGCMGLAYSDLKKDKKARWYYKQALKVCGKSGYRRGECEEIGFIGNALSDQGEYEEAIKQYEMALEVATEIKDEGKEETWREALRDKQEVFLGALGLTYNDMGEYEEAIEYYKQAVKIAKEIEDKVGEETWLGYMGLACSALGKYIEAVEYYKEALKISTEVEDKDWKETWLGALGFKYSKLEEFIEAIKDYGQKPEILKETGNKQRRNIQLGNFDLYPRGAR